MNCVEKILRKRICKGVVGYEDPKFDSWVQEK